MQSQPMGQQLDHIYYKDVGNELAHLAVLAKVVACRPSSVGDGRAPPAPSQPLGKPVGSL
jgi:hypothetical protein